MKKWLLLNILLVLGLTTRAQQPRFDHFDVTKGLSQNNVNSLMIDSTGYVWMGTLHGLNRYNGYDFEVFKPESNSKTGLTGNNISSICQGINGDVWVVTGNGGLNQYSGLQEQFYFFPDSLFPGINIQGVDEMLWHHEMLWMRNQNIIGAFDPTTLQFYTYFHPNLIMGMCFSAQNNIVAFGPWGKATMEIKNKKITLSKYSSVETWAMSYGKSCTSLETGYIVHSTKNKTDTLINLNNYKDLNLQYSQIEDILKIKDEIWIGGASQLYRFLLNQNVYQSFHYNPENRFSFKGYHINSLKADKAENVWIGTAKHGINLFNRSKNQFLHYNWNFFQNEGRSIDPVRAICRTQNGDLWLGFDRVGIGRIGVDSKQELYTSYFDEWDKEHPIYFIRHIYEDSYGNLWGCGQNELIQFNAEKNRFETIGCRHEWRWPFRSYVIDENEPGLLMLTGGRRIGVVNLETDNLATLPLSQNGVSINRSIRDIVYDSQQNLWIATDGDGMVKITYPDFQFKSITSESHQVCDNKIYALATRHDSLWIATNNGLSLFNTKKDSLLKTWREEDGLTNNIVYALHLYQNQLWMSTNQGLCRFHFNENRFETHLQDDFFMDDAHFVSHTGEVLFGGYNGIVAFHPNRMKTISEAPTPIIEKFSIFNKVVQPNRPIDGRGIISQSISTLPQLKLHHLHHTFSFQYNAFPFQYPNNHQFRYRLKNWQDQWIVPSNDNNLANYTRVSPGKYTFQVSVMQPIGNWSKPTEIPIHIVPPFWQRLAFKIGLLILLAISIGLLVQFRIQAVKKRAIILKQKVDEQTSELKAQNQKIKDISQQLHEADQSKLRFFTNISHEFRTPITLIIGYLEQMDKEDLNKGKKIIRNNALRLLRMVNQLIDIRKLDQNQMKLHVSSFDLSNWLNEIVLIFEHMAHQKNIVLQFHSSLKSSMVWLDSDMMEKILFNLITNSIKYSNSNDSITIFLDEDKTHYLLKVCDTGIGISEEELPHIFDRFYRSKEKENQQKGHGIGLALVKELVHLQKGNIEVESKKGEGSQFTLYLLKGKDHFNPEDFSSHNPIFTPQESTIKNTPKLTPEFSNADLLIVEDNPDLSEYLKELLKPYFNIKLAFNGVEALKQIEESTPHLIISDVMMPVMDGFELCEKLKANEQTRSIPFIMLTARNEIDLKIEGFNLGIDDYIEKPFDPNVLIARVHALLANRDNIEQTRPVKITPFIETKKRKKIDQEFLRKVEKIVSENYSSPQFTLDQLSEMLSISRATFFRRFKTLTGITPSEYLRNYRIDKAIHLINQEELTITQISAEVGFQSPSHFRKIFKAEFGVTPGEYGKKL